MLLIIDNKSNFIKNFKKDFLSKQQFNYIYFSHNEQIDLSLKNQVKGIILSGGNGNPYNPSNLSSNYIALNNFDVPVMGVCLGHEIIAVFNGGEIKKLPKHNDKLETIRITKPEDPIFNGIKNREIELLKRHDYHVYPLPDNFESLANSETCPNEIIKHKKKPIYGFQSHPENSGVTGMIIIKNFLKICKLL